MPFSFRRACCRNPVCRRMFGRGFCDRFDDRDRDRDRDRGRDRDRDRDRDGHHRR